MAECIFCRMVRGEMATEKVYEDQELLAFKDIAPQAPVHWLIIPKTHIETVAEVSQQQAGLLGRMILRANHLAAKAQIQEAGYRLVINCNAHGGQAVYHLHLHLLGGRQLQWPPG